MKAKKKTKKQIKKKPQTVADILKKKKEAEEKKQQAEIKKQKLQQEKEEKRLKKQAEKDKKSSGIDAEKKEDIEDSNDDLDKLRNPATYLAFIDFIATPKNMRDIETQQEFSKKFHINENTLTRWKRRDGFWDDVRVIRKQIIREDCLPMALMSLKRTALRDGKAPEVKLLFQLADEFEEKSVVETRKPTKLSDQRKQEIANCLKAWKGKRNGQFTPDTNQ